MGHMRPMILMPVGLLTGLPAGQIESILLHELAHIRRCDYLVNMLQTVSGRTSCFIIRRCGGYPASSAPNVKTVATIWPLH